MRKRMRREKRKSNIVNKPSSAPGTPFVHVLSRDMYHPRTPNLNGPTAS